AASKAKVRRSSSNDATSIDKNSKPFSFTIERNSSACSCQRSNTRCSHIPLIAEISTPSYPHAAICFATVAKSKFLNKTEFTPRLIILPLPRYDLLLLHQQSFPFPTI